jgi:hypothetical protein
MGLKCPKCGVDNLLTAIFCRGCGEKLDLNEMKPDDVLNDEHTKSQRKGASKAQKTFVGVFFGLLGIIVLLAMCPVGAKGTAEGEVDKTLKTGFDLVNKNRPSAPPASGKGNKKAGAKKGVSKAKALPPPEITSDDASKLMSLAMGLPKDQWPQGPLVPKHFSVDFKAGNSFKIVVKTKAFGVLPVSCTANAKIQEAEGQGTKYDYVLGSPRLGMLPLFVYGDLSLSLIQNLMNSVSAFQTIKTASEITTSDGKITVKF